MADNITLNAGTGGSALRTDDDGTAHWQYVKLAFGADNTQTIVSASNPLPVTVTDAAVTVDNGGTFAVQVDSSALPTGAATAANQATTNTALSAIQTAVEVIDNAISGTEMQVDVLTMPTTTVTNAGTFATQVDGAALTALQLIDDSVFADDAAFTLASSKVTVAGAIRDDALSTLTAIEGDAVPLRVSSTGALHVTGGGGGTEYNEDDASPNPIVGTATLMERDDALSTLTPIEGDFVGLRSNSRGALWVEHDTNTPIPVTDNGTTLSIDDGAGSITVDGTVTANLSATDNAVLDSIDAAVNGTLTVGSHAVTNAGTFAVQVNGAALTALQLIDDAVHTDDAAFTLGTSKGVMMMGFAGTQSVNANDAAALACDTDGALHISDGGNTITVDGTVTANLSATDNAVLDNIDTQTTPAQSHYRNVDANAEAAIKGSAGTLHWLHVMNMTAAVAYLHLYDATTASVTPGTTTPTFTFPIPTQGDTNGAGFNLPLGPNGHAFATAITLVCTTTIDGSTGDPGTNGVFVNAGYT